MDMAQAILLFVGEQVPACSEASRTMTASYVYLCRPVVDRILRSAYSSGTRDLGAASPVAVLQVDQPLHEVVQAVGRVEPRLLPTSAAKISHVKASWPSVGVSAAYCQQIVVATESPELGPAGSAQRNNFCC